MGDTLLSYARTFTRSLRVLRREFPGVPLERLEKIAESIVAQSSGIPDLLERIQRPDPREHSAVYHEGPGGRVVITPEGEVPLKVAVISVLKEESPLTSPQIIDRFIKRGWAIRVLPSTRSAPASLMLNHLKGYPKVYHRLDLPEKPGQVFWELVPDPV